MRLLREVVLFGRRAFAIIPRAAYILLLLIVILSMTAPRFLTVGNLTNVGRDAAILALAAYGQAAVLVAGGYDLSMGSSVALISVTMVLTALRYGIPAAFAIGILTALVIGALNGFFIVRFDLSPFLVTLGMLTGVHGLASLLVGGIPLEAPPGAGLSWIGRESVRGIPVPILLATLGFLALLLLLNRTSLGRSWYLIGASVSAARTAGVHIKRAVWLGYVVESAFVATAGLILTSRVNSGQPNLYPRLPFEAIAACAIGGLPLTGGAGTPSQVLMGVLIITAVGNGLRLLNFSSDVQLMFIGIATVGAVLVQSLRWRLPEFTLVVRPLGRSVYSSKPAPPLQKRQ